MNSTVNTLTNAKNSSDSLIEATWPKKILQLFKPAQNKFIFKATNTYKLDSTYNYPIKPVKIDTFMVKKIHSYYKISPKSTYIFNQDIETYSYYSMDLPINNLYPVCLIQRQKFGFYALQLVLFDKSGVIKNIIQVGSLTQPGRGFIGGPHPANDTLAAIWKMSDYFHHISYSEKINDSTLKFTSISPDPKTITDKHKWECIYKQNEIIIHKDASIEYKNHKTWKE